MTRRCHDWQPRLEACINQRYAMPFEWGINDCCIFVCAAVEAVTGRNPLRNWQFAHWSALSAARVIRKNGGIAAIASAQLGASITPDEAQPGDVGMFDESGANALAVWCGAAWMCPGANGLQVLKPETVVSAWRCCRE